MKHLKIMDNGHVNHCQEGNRYIMEKIRRTVGITKVGLVIHVHTLLNFTTELLLQIRQKFFTNIIN